MFDLRQYSSNIQMILGPHAGGARLMPLAPAAPWGGPGLELLKKATARQLFDNARVVSAETAECVRSALFLYFSALDESHEISQGIQSSTGSFLHGIMHRQEPDFGNAKYWFRRVPSHDIFPALREACLKLFETQDSSAAKLLGGEIEEKPRWDPQWFIDQCEATHGGGSADFEQRLMEIQLLEWQLLFEYSYQRAVGKP